MSSPLLASPSRRPLHPHVVLAIAILLPGFGHVVCGRARRGLTLQLFMISLAFVTWNLTTPAQSFAGRLAGGLFIYAMSIPDAYRTAKLRWALAREAQNGRQSAEDGHLDTHARIPQNVSM
ncbi:MAG TPA: hypothetical protein VNH44_04130 [Micropepsaceae bacterium]|nr:hypothetical protein [Micropepsaceae bacterium]